MRGLERERERERGGADVGYGLENEREKRKDSSQLPFPFFSPYNFRVITRSETFALLHFFPETELALPCYRRLEKTNSVGIACLKAG